MDDSKLIPGSPPQRLCSEIQLFDLCDLTSCRFKSGRFCGCPDLLERFEKIADEEQRQPERYIDEELEEGSEEDEDGYSDYDLEEEGDWEDEEPFR